MSVFEEHIGTIELILVFSLPDVVTDPVYMFSAIHLRIWNSYFGTHTHILKNWFVPYGSTFLELILV